MKVIIYLHGSHKSSRVYDLENETDKRIVESLEKLYGSENIKKVEVK